MPFAVPYVGAVNEAQTGGLGVVGERDQTGAGGFKILVICGSRYCRGRPPFVLVFEAVPEGGVRSIEASQGVAC